MRGNAVIAGLVGGVLALAACGGDGCRCGRSTPGKVGRATTALEAIPADVNAVILVDTAGLRQGSLGEFVYAPWVVRQFEEWGGAPCGALPARLVSAAAFGIRLSREGAPAREFFFAAEGATIDDVRRCIDGHAGRQGLSSSYEDVGGVRALTDGRGLHVLAAGERVVARAFPFADTDVLGQVSGVVLGDRPSLASREEIRGLLERLGGDVTIALSETRELFAAYGRGLEDSVAARVPGDLCASPTEIAFFLTTARALGFGNLSGIERFVGGKFRDLPQICVADAVREALRTIGQVQAAGVTLTGRADIEIGLLLVFADDGPAAETRGVLGDLVHVLQVLPENLDSIERDWPMAATWLARRMDLSALRTTLRNPALRHITVGGEGATVELRLRIEEEDVRAAVDATQRLLAELVTKQ